MTVFQVEAADFYLAAPLKYGFMVVTRLSAQLSKACARAYRLVTHADECSFSG